MDLSDFLATTPETLAQNQKNALKRAAVERLRLVADLLMTDSYEKVEAMLSYSPAGDGMGCENDYLDFSDLLGIDEADLGTVLEKLRKLTVVANGQA